MAAKKSKTSPKKVNSKPSVVDFCRAYLRKKPDAPFAEIRDAAKKKRLLLYPVSYGRAKALEGLVKVSPYGSKKAAKKKTPAKRGRPKGSKNKPKTAAAAKRGPGRPKGSKNRMAPRKRTDPGPMDNLVSAVKTLQQERDQALRIIEKVRELIASLA